jgi:hypothetical protein
MLTRSSIKSHIAASNSTRSSSRKTVKPQRFVETQMSLFVRIRKDTYVRNFQVQEKDDGLHGYDGTDGFVVRDFDEHVDAEEEDNEELVQTDDETETEKDDDVELDDDDTEDEDEEEDESN